MFTPSMLKNHAMSLGKKLAITVRTVMAPASYTEAADLLHVVLFRISKHRKWRFNAVRTYEPFSNQVYVNAFMVSPTYSPRMRVEYVIRADINRTTSDRSCPDETDLRGWYVVGNAFEVHYSDRVLEWKLGTDYNGKRMVYTDIPGTPYALKITL